MANHYDPNGTRIYRHYKYAEPPEELLKANKITPSADELAANAKKLEEIMPQFIKAEAKVVSTIPGPQVTRYEMAIAPNTPLKSILQHSADIAYELAVNGAVRIEAPIIGKRGIIAIEVPNKKRAIVGLHEIITSCEFIVSRTNAIFAVGRSFYGDSVVSNLETIPHLLIAGQANSGIYEWLSSFIVSLMYKSGPDDVKFILIGSGRSQLSLFNAMPHMLVENIIAGSGEALNALKWAINEVSRRKVFFQHYDCTTLSEYNALPDVNDGNIAKMPRVVIVINDLANLQHSCMSRAIEDSIAKIAGDAKQTGIHLVIASSDTSCDVISGSIKCNINDRIAFKVKDPVSSRIVLDKTGAETLLGRGDMLYYPSSVNKTSILESICVGGCEGLALRCADEEEVSIKPYNGNKEWRVQGAYITEEEICAVVEYMQDHYESDFDKDIEKFLSNHIIEKCNDGIEMDPLASRVMAHAITTGSIYPSLIWNRFDIDLTRAKRLIRNLEQRGFLGPITGEAKPRDILMTREQYKEVFGYDIDEV